MARGSNCYPRRIVSGGQTGVDRAALDVAHLIGLERGGWCPRGRRAEDGVIPACYALQETPTADYAERTEWNVRDSDATLVLRIGQASGGTALTLAMVRKHHKPCFQVDLAAPVAARTVRAWLRREKVVALNVAGPRESGSPGIYQRAAEFLEQVLAR